MGFERRWFLRHFRLGRGHRRAGACALRRAQCSARPLSVMGASGALGEHHRGACVGGNRDGAREAFPSRLTAPFAADRPADGIVTGLDECEVADHGGFDDDLGETGRGRIGLDAGSGSSQNRSRLRSKLQIHSSSSIHRYCLAHRE